MHVSLREERDADRRARELYHYFQPDNPALLPPRDSRVTLSTSTVKSSPNLVLTALTQLAAVKLGVQRAIISLIDRETLYVVAEASRSLHLRNSDSYDDDGDGLWMGCTRGPVAGTLCEVQCQQGLVLTSAFTRFANLLISILENNRIASHARTKIPFLRCR